MLSSNSSNNLRLFFKNKTIKKVFLISGNNSFYKSGANKIFPKILKEKIVEFYFKTSNIPDLKELKKIAVLINKFKPDCILAVGGGAVLDYAKMANVLDLEKDLENKIKKSILKIKKKKCKLIAVPTTAGSGAEVTENAVVYVDKIKYSLEDKIIKPDDFFIIPKLIIDCSRQIKSAAGFDAISQALESILSIKANSKSMQFAKKSLELSLPSFINHVNRPTISNTENMALAAHYSGKAISITKTTAPHAVSYPFTSHFGIKHGHAVSLTLNEFIKFNFLNQKYETNQSNLKKKYEFIFKITKTKNISELDEYLKNLKKEAHLESNFLKLGINIKKNYQKILSGINFQRLKNNPIELQISDIKSILLNKS